MLNSNPFEGKHHSEKTKQILKQKSKKQWEKKSPEDKQLMVDKAAAKNTGQKKSKEFCEIISYYRKLQFPPKAKKFLITSPTEISYIVHGNLQNFLKERNLSQSLFRRFINKGKIIGKQHKQSEQIKNSIGWEIRDYFL